MKIEISENQYRKLKESLRLYHGSPHDFEKFSTEKVLTGEGANAKGWGLYFSSKESVARHYRDCLTHAGDDMIGNMLVSDYYDKMMRRADRMEDPDLEYEKLGFLEDLDLTRNFDQSLDRVDSDEVREWAEREIKPKYKPAGHIYCVIVNKGKSPNQYRYIDWEGTIDESEANSILNQIKKELPNYVEESEDALGLSEGYYGDHPMGMQLYSYLSAICGSEKNASLFLMRSGIDGIRYRATEDVWDRDEDNTYNYVIFDENSVNLEEKKKF